MPDEPSTPDEPNTSRTPGNVTYTSTQDTTLGDGGKKALEAEREQRKTLEKQLREAQSAIKNFEDRDKTELQRAADRAAEAEKRLQEVEQTQKNRDREFKVRLALRGKVVDDDVALPLILKKLGDDDPTDRRIEKTLDELLNEKPYLAPQSTSRDWGSGARPGAAKQNLNDWFRDEVLRPNR